MLCNKTWYMFPLSRQGNLTWLQIERGSSLTRKQNIFISFPSKETAFESPIH